MRRSLVVALLAPSCLAAACGSSGPDFGSLGGESADQILTLSTTAITADTSSFHFVDQSRVGAKTTTLVGDDTAAGADQTLSGSGPALQVVRRSDGSLYIRGAAAALQGALGLSPAIAAARAGAWISLQSGDGPYATVAVTLDPQKELDAFVPVAPFQVQLPRQFHGRTVVPVSGAARATAANGTGHVVTLYVPTEAPYTPVGATLTFGSGATAGVEAVVFSRWGKKVNPPAPTGAVAFSSLTG